jgi:DNA polymerase-1
MSTRVTETGRRVSDVPALQNLPLRTEFGRRLRDAFTRKDPFVVTGVDFAELEMRLMKQLDKKK